ncbi:MAG: Uma2 family endonuclease, partial [Silvibacterium sp.]|nr:Uma2 family endonuclease [Silvibacterium sp.]
MGDWRGQRSLRTLPRREDGGSAAYIHSSRVISSLFLRARRGIRGWRDRRTSKGGEYDHASWQDAILAWFRQHAQEWNVRSKPELRVQVAPTRYRVPDVTVLDRDRPIEQIITRAPIAVFEVLSPEDSMTRMMRKLNDYAAMGIPQIWVIDPR